MWFFNSLKVRICGLVVAMGLLSSMASAATVVTLAGITPASGDYTWTYNVYLDNAEYMQSGSPGGDFFALLDVIDYVGGTAAFVPVSGTWAVSIENTTVLPPGPVSYADNASILNIRVDYISGANIVNIPTTGKTLLGQLSFDDKQSKATGGYNVGREHSSLTNGFTSDTDPSVVPIPLPAAAWSGMALLGLIGAAKLRKSL